MIVTWTGTVDVPPTGTAFADGGVIDLDAVRGDRLHLRRHATEGDADRGLESAAGDGHQSPPLGLPEFGDTEAMKKVAGSAMRRLAWPIDCSRRAWMMTEPVPCSTGGKYGHRRLPARVSSDHRCRTALRAEAPGGGGHHEGGAVGRRLAVVTPRHPDRDLDGVVAPGRHLRRVRDTVML